MGSDWLSRVTIPDLYPRESDPYRPRMGDVGPNVTGPIDGGGAAAPLTVNLTQPGQRPTVVQRAVNYALSVTTGGVPLVANRLEVDAILIDVPSSALNSVFLGYGGAGVTTSTGIEIQAGIPFFYSPDNTREQWELQAILEYMALLMGYQAGVAPLPTYRAPRVVLDASQWNLIAAATTSVIVTLFYIPEQQ